MPPVKANDVLGVTMLPPAAPSEVPSGYDAYLLVNVLHDWNDDSCVQILANTAAAGSGGSRIIGVDSNRRCVPRDDLALRADILMAALTNGGHERTDTEFAQLGEGAGLVKVSTTLLASGDHAHDFRVCHHLSGGHG